MGILKSDSWLFSLPSMAFFQIKKKKVTRKKRVIGLIVFEYNTKLGQSRITLIRSPEGQWPWLSELTIRITR